MTHDLEHNPACRPPTTLEFVPPSETDGVLSDDQEFQRALNDALDPPDEPVKPDTDEEKSAEEAKVDQENPTPEPDPAPVETPDEPTSEEKSDDTAEKEGGEEGPDDDKDELSEKEIEDLSSKSKDRRWHQMARQRMKYKNRTEELENAQAQLAQAAGLEAPEQLTAEFLREQSQKAAGLNDLQEFMGENKLMPADVQTGLTAMAAITAGDWKTFMGIVQPYLEIARAQTDGNTLPIDIQQAVERGEYSEEFGRKYAQERAQASEKEIAARRAQSQVHYQATQSQNSQAQQQANVAAQVKREVASWEARTAQADPDFEHKAELIKELLQARVSRDGAPRDSQTAIQWATEAHERATNLLVKNSQTPPPPKPNTPPTATPPSPASVQQHAETFEQAMEQALALTS